MIPFARLTVGIVATALALLGSLGGAASIPDPLTISAPTPQEGALFGASVAAGDIDGDGKDDIAVGAPWEDVGSSANQGRVRVYSGATEALMFSLDTPDPEPYVYFGSTLALGDVNGDGRADVAVGAPYYRTDGYISQGRVYVFSGADGKPLLTVEPPSPQPFAVFGYAVALADLDGDSRAEVIATAPGEDVGGNPDQGRVYIFSGATGVLLRTVDSPTAISQADFGASVAVGDANGDGTPDITVGAPYETVNGAYGVGRVHLISGANGALLRTLESPQTAQPARLVLFGKAVAMADTNGDGAADVAAAAFPEGSNGVTTATVDLFSGANGSFLRTSSFLSCGTSHLTLAVGDFDGDSQADVAPGASGDINGNGSLDRATGCPNEELGQGRVYVLYDAEGDGDALPDDVDNCPRVANPDQADGDLDGRGDACDADRDGDTVTDFSDACPSLPEDLDSFRDGDGCPDSDNDQDGIADVYDFCPGTDFTAGPDGMADTGDEPRDAQGVPIQTKEDYDGVADSDGCHDSPGDDYDGDGFTNDVEAHVGTDPASPCGRNGWPADLFSGNAGASALDLRDVATFIVPIPRTGTSPADPGFDVRWDLVPGPGGFGTAHINIRDMSALIVLSPAMLQGALAFNGPPCPAPSP